MKGMSIREGKLERVDVRVFSVRRVDCGASYPEQAQTGRGGRRACVSSRVCRSKRRSRRMVKCKYSHISPLIRLLDAHEPRNLGDTYLLPPRFSPPAGKEEQSTVGKRQKWKLVVLGMVSEAYTHLIRGHDASAPPIRRPVGVGQDGVCGMSMRRTKA